MGRKAGKKQKRTAMSKVQVQRYDRSNLRPQTHNGMGLTNKQDRRKAEA